MAIYTDEVSRNYPIISAGGKNLGFTNGRYLKFGKGNEDNERNDLLEDLQLIGSEFAVAEAIAGNLEAVLREGYEPTDEDDTPEITAAVFEVAVPSDGHEEVGAQQQEDGRHFFRVAGRGFAGRSRGVGVCVSRGRRRGPRRVVARLGLR